MGKAGKWIRNLLLGKKEQEKLNTKAGDGSRPQEASTAIIPATPKRRWSFRRSSNAEKLLVNHKSCRSFDSIITSQLVSQALFDYAINQQNHQTIRKAAVTTKAWNRISRADAMAAATKIQAAFRSYLARKALCALRGLVKLQALVRGHLVRKRTTTMVRCMSALVAIQVRARFQRIQMVEDGESRTNVGSTTSKQGFMMAHERRLSAPQLDHNERMRDSRSKGNTSISYRQSSRRFSIDSSASKPEKSIRLRNKQIDEASTTSQTSTQHDEPNYMTRTMSSRAKARSHSEPRQRPTKQGREKRRTSSNEGLNVVNKEIQTHEHEMDHERWLTKLHGSAKLINDLEFDSASTFTNDSSYYTTLYAYEVGTLSILLLFFPVITIF
ncbi:hypothetical protein CTI12_AA508540 [Artemisia annua]|uniref:DUF4005 domain-containing protein n=1 Tax=Artemisia annua TaxID=35608 RepID=A0A2U1LBT4_ARTAN|nr:hypothetical protein CTI12_AA508540 [Artemisia annua]